MCRDKLDEPERALMSFLAVDETVINNTESSIRGQFQSQWWKEEGKFRLTASKFDLKVERRRNFETFATELINSKPFTSRYVECGIKNEPVAHEAYEKLM